MLSDAHIHLQDISSFETEAFLGQCKTNRINTLLSNSAKYSDWKTLKSLAENNKNIVPFFGLHPWYIEDVPEDWLFHLVKLLLNSNSGIGEIGLDRVHNNKNLDDQRDTFLSQLHLAIEVDKPAVIHCVKTWGPLLEIIRKKDFDNLVFMIHNFSGSKEILKELVDRGGYISFSLRILNKHIERIDELISLVPEDKILLETDYPYCTSKYDKEAVNKYIEDLTQTYKLVADIKSIPVENLYKLIDANTNKFTSKAFIVKK